jgi:hypothetical protein
MTTAIETRLTRILKCNMQTPFREWARLCDMADTLVKLGKKEPYRDEVLAALMKIARHQRARGLGLHGLAELVRAQDVELQEYLRASLHEEWSACSSLKALLKLRGQGVYADAIGQIANKRLSNVARVSVLEILSEHSGHRFDELVTKQDANEVQESDLPLAELRAWQRGGYGKFVPPKIVLPEKELKQAGLKLPPDYRRFLLQHRGRKRLKAGRTLWDLTPAARLLEKTKVDGRNYPAISVLRGYAAAMKDACEDGQTCDAKGKPYPLARLAAGLALGMSDDGDVLFLDPAAKYSVWIFHHDGGDVEQAAPSFAAWQRKTRKVND